MSTLDEAIASVDYILDCLTAYRNMIKFEVYDKNCTEKATDEKDFYFRSGNANAVGYICGRFGIDITKLIKQRNRRASDDRNQRS